MTSEEIHQIIDLEVRQSTQMDVHLKLKVLSRLVHPQKLPFLVDLDWNQSLDLWLVYEQSDDGSEFKIVYDEMTGKYGLAIGLGGVNQGLVLRFYSTFQDSLREFYPSEIDFL